MSAFSGRVAWFAGAVVVASSMAIWLLGRRSVDLEPPDLISRGLASATLLAVPGIIAWIGAATRRPPVVLAAGILCFLQSVVAFSGVTLVYLVPAIALLRAAADRDDPAAQGPVRPVRLLVAALVAIPIAILVVLQLGVFGVLALVAVAGLAASRPPGTGERAAGGGSALRAVAIVALVVGAWAASLALTETTCWVGRVAPGGGIAWQRIPPSGTLTVGPGEIASTCGGGTITPAGIAWAGGLVALAITAAAWRPRGGSAVGHRG